MDVRKGPVAIRAGKYWVGVASGNRYAKNRRMTPEAAIADAEKLEPPTLPTIEQRLDAIEKRLG